MRALRRPSPKTVWVAFLYRPHPRQPAAASRSARIEVRSGRKAWAPVPSARLSRRRVGLASASIDPTHGAAQPAGIAGDPLPRIPLGGQPVADRPDRPELGAETAVRE